MTAKETIQKEGVFRSFHFEQNYRVLIMWQEDGEKVVVIVVARSHHVFGRFIISPSGIQ